LFAIQRLDLNLIGIGIISWLTLPMDGERGFPAVGAGKVKGQQARISSFQIQGGQIKGQRWICSSYAVTVVLQGLHCF
jgi:hypothetical protein